MNDPVTRRRHSAEQVRRRRNVAVRAGVGLVVVVGLLFVVVFPVRTWIDQRAAVERSVRQLEVLEAERQRLAASKPGGSRIRARSNASPASTTAWFARANRRGRSFLRRPRRPRPRCRPRPDRHRVGTLRAMTDPTDVLRVAELLGREPRAPFDVAVRNAEGDPMVIRNAPFLDDGTPMPTTYWLVDPDLSRRGRPAGGRRRGARGDGCGRPRRAGGRPRSVCLATRRRDRRRIITARDRPVASVARDTG